MLVSEAKSVLATYQAALESADASCQTTAIRGLVRAIEGAGTMTVAKFVATFASKNFDTSSDCDLTLGDAVPSVAALLDLLQKIGAKKALITDLLRLLDLIRKHSEVSIQIFDSAVVQHVADASSGKSKRGKAPMDRQLVDSYIERLNKTLGDDVRFREVYQELCADERVTKLEAVALASNFLGPIAASTSRPKALQRILYRHEKLLDSRAASASIGGGR